jgi:hypothetical protein
MIVRVRHAAIETSRGPLVEALLDRGAHVYAINPKQLDRATTSSARWLSAKRDRPG